jgi:hypothetical protein
MAGGALVYETAGAGLTAPAAHAATLTGGLLWSDPATWDGRPPGPGDVVTVANSVVLDTDVHVAGVVIEPGATLSFDPGKTITLESTGNVVVRGTLAMRPDASARHRLVLTDVAEAVFVGSGMSVIAADVGVWVMGQGRLDVMGVPKTAWLGWPMTG